jgi:DNA invertase Pin-like site-specific DNA recombinase
MQLYIGYVRVSTKEQGISGLGLEAQRVALRAWAEQQGVDLLLLEDVLTGKDADRPGLDQARYLLAAGLATGLVVAKLDRLSRSMLDFATVVKESLDKDQPWRLVVLTPDIDLGTKEGRLFAHMLMAFAEYERELIGDRTKEGLAIARANGTALGGRQKVPVEPDLLARIQFMKDSGSNPCAIARLLNDEGTASPTGKRWHPPTISRLLAA